MNSPNATQIQAVNYLSGLSELIQGQLEAACADVVQTGSLLDEAIDQLNFSFNALHEGLALHEAALATDTDGPSLTQHVNSAVTGLQFHDLTNQLLQRIRLRLESLRDVVATGPVLDGAEPDWSRALETLATQQTAVEQQLQGALRQHDLDSGEIELF